MTDEMAEAAHQVLIAAKNFRAVCEREGIDESVVRLRSRDTGDSVFIADHHSAERMWSLL